MRGRFCADAIAPDERVGGGGLGRPLVVEFTFVKRIRHVVALQSLAPRGVRRQRSVTDRLWYIGTPETCLNGEMKFRFSHKIDCYLERAGFSMEKEPR